MFGETSTGNIMNSTFTSNKASQAGGAGELRSSWLCSYCCAAVSRKN